MFRFAASALFASLLPGAAYADLVVRFVEGAPKDRFELRNSGACPLGPGQITIDLSPAPAGLIFDTTAAGAGFSVFQPFEVVDGADLLQGEPQVIDGDTSLVLAHGGMAAGRTIAFTIDVDDVAGKALGQTRVSGAEIAGAEIVLGQDGASTRAAFMSDAVARVPTAACLS